MDFSSFINSRDIRDYHRQIGHSYNATEAAWLVFMCDSINILKKHEAWKWINDNMLDEIVFLGCEDDYSKAVSLHRVLGEFIKIENDYIECLSDSDGRECNDLIAGYIYQKTGMDIDILNFFQLIEPVFPSPFKAGDILCCYGYNGLNIPFVYSPSEKKDDLTLVYGYTVDNKERNGRLNYAYPHSISGVRRTCSYSWDYLTDIEYYREELAGSDRLLIPISKWLKGEYDNNLAGVFG